MTGPTRTLEVRWFGRGAVLPTVEAWFDRLGPAVETERRTDRYLAPTDDALAIKWRGGEGVAAIEPKRREAVGEALRAGRAEAPSETWTKWSFPLPDDDAPEAWVAVEKRRRQRREGAPDVGVALEVTSLSVGGEAWWTVALEATAADVADRARLLQQAAVRWLGRDDAPALGAAAARGYAAWLLERGEREEEGGKRVG